MSSLDVELLRDSAHKSVGCLSHEFSVLHRTMKGPDNRPYQSRKYSDCPKTPLLDD